MLAVVVIGIYGKRVVVILLYRGIIIIELWRKKKRQTILTNENAHVYDLITT